MPYAPARACPCGGRITKGQCDRCSKGKRARDTRKHAAARGYDYQWQQFRITYLAQYPLCQDCLNPDPLNSKHAFEQPQPIITAATDIHHKQKLRDRPELKYDHDNLRGLCPSCHAKRTARGE